MSKVIKISVLGSGGVGKSAITVQFVSDHFVEIYDPTIEDFSRKLYHFQGNHYMLEILDTAGQEEYTCLLDQYLNISDAFILVFDLTNLSSLDKVMDIKFKIDQIKEDPNIVLCGNKCDLGMKRIIEDQGREIADQWKCKYFESSAKLRINVDILFQTCILNFEEKTNKSKKWDKRSSSSRYFKSSNCLLL
jgi:GTPase KRas protein